MEELNKTNKNIDLGDCINESFETYKKGALQCGLAFMTIIAIVCAFAFIAIASFTDLKTFSESMKDFNPKNLSTEGILIYYGIVLAFGILIAPFNAGLIKMMQQADQEEEVNFKTFFSYVNSKYYGQLVVLTLILSIFSVTINHCLGLILPEFTAGIIGMLLSLVVSVLTFVCIPAIIFKDLNAIDAIKYSINHMSNNFVTILILTIIGFIGGYVGAIACCVGMFFTFPILYAMHYTVFKKIESNT
ncbi:hypothetical protein [Flavobacterium sp.]|uniref:hypothetical protein n=1 Tax=Flavobacterium sp. TaxID=239 RepID=UPI00286E3648|nr:hypothetical protein [Flavobacterium sp.]